MSKKRQIKDKGVPQTPAKVAKKDPLEFNGTVFKTMLKDPTTVKKGKCNWNQRCADKLSPASDSVEHIFSEKLR